MRGAVIPLGRLGVTPNMLTVLGVIISLSTAYLFTLSSKNKEFLIYCGSLILLSGFVDAIDGILARSINRVTRFGGYFDSVADRYSDAVIYTGIIAAGLCNQIIGLIALFGSLLVSYTRARAEMEGIKMAGIGLGERAERMILLSLCSIIAYWWQQALDYGVFILAIIAHITVIQRTMYFKKEIER
jgi:archaetidylinositol phosphate synthase